ncbi:MAG: hypothetical protein ACE5RN_07340 [Nitrosopumilaceae archaeon]
MPQKPSNLLIIFQEPSMMRKNIQVFGKKYDATCFESQLFEETVIGKLELMQKIGGQWSN